MNKLFQLIVFSVLLLLPVGAQNVHAGIIDTTITVIKTVTNGGPLDASSFDLFVDDGTITQAQNGIPESVTPGLIIISESLSGPLVNQYLPTFSGNCVEDSLNDDRRNQIFDLVSKANTLQSAINSEPGNPLNDDREQSIHDLLSKARTLLSALSASLTIDEGEDLTCQITNEFLPVVLAEQNNQQVGGELIPINTSALLIAGAQNTSSWLIPIIVAGIGFVLVFKKSKNY